MAVREQNLYRVWNGEALIVENIDFLLRRTNPVSFPLNEESKQIIEDLRGEIRLLTRTIANIAEGEQS